MRIVGSKNNVIDADLLERLAKSKMSPSGVSLAEAQKHVASARRDLKDEFSGASSVRGLAQAQTAIENTLKLALSSGWVNKGDAKKVINAFLTASNKTGLEATVTKLREEIRGTSSGSVGYGSRPSRPSRPSSGGYGGRRTTSVGT
jgi:murein L,D-transpeptidase YcbB/YkuD